MVSKRSYLLSIIFLLVIIFLSPACAGEQQKVLVLEISDSITPVSDDIVLDAISMAESGGFAALVITLNTPGGGLDETFSIIESIDQTEVPVIGYVYPEGVKAWSAGTLILISTDIAAMAPHTIIGSAQPVEMSATGIEPIEDSKIVNAIVALAREKALMHGRNETVAEEFITKNLNLNAESALDVGVIEIIAPTIEDLLVQVDGEVIKGKTLNTSDAAIEYYTPPIRLSFMNIISNPLISSILMMLGIYGVVFGISNPGVGAEIFGIIAITLGLIGTGFDVNIGAVFLLLVGIALVVLELQAPGFGVFGISGMICLIAGSILLVPTSFPNYYTPADFQKTMMISIAAPTVVIGIVMVFAIYKVMEVRHRRPVVGEIIGDIAQAIDPLEPGTAGFVRHKGEYWKARVDEPVAKGEKVEIIEKDGIVLVVKRISQKD
ncbi:MAG TPA: nodulation protein NfeD [Methanosarcinaceae archaeon]|nr:nodulation protein NfeD [Methanosarcinaceae archaeon]